MFLSHRIAGPLFNLKMQLKRLKNSKNKEDLLNIPEAKFREHDFFHDLAHRYNEAIENVQNIIDEAENSNKKKDHDVVVPINSQKDKKVA
jgi:methyl-accepting chemotaxis protein